MPDYTHAANVRKARLTFARTARQPTAELNAILLDPDLAPEARIRRAAPIRAKLKQLAEAAQKEAAEHVTASREQVAASRPSVLRRAEAFKHPTRASAIMGLIQGANVGELQALAELATAQKDAPAAYAVARALEGLRDSTPGKVSDADAAKVVATLDSVAALDTKVARVDFIVANAEALRLEREALRLATGEELDPLEQMRLANQALSIELYPGTTESLTSAELEECYTLTGVSMASPLELLPVVSPMSATERMLADPMSTLRDANRDALELTDA